MHSGERPQRLLLPLVNGALELGRDELAAAGLPDGRMSRRHVRVEIADDGWAVSDLGSRKGAALRLTAPGLPSRLTPDPILLRRCEHSTSRSACSSSR